MRGDSYDGLRWPPSYPSFCQDGRWTPPRRFHMMASPSNTSDTEGSHKGAKRPYSGNGDFAATQTAADAVTQAAAAGGSLRRAAASSGEPSLIGPPDHGVGAEPSGEATSDDPLSLRQLDIP